MNKKGITIIELIITIALVSVIMTFLYNLLSNISFESDNEFIDITDIEVRNDIIRTINDSINMFNYNDYIETDANGNDFSYDCLGSTPTEKINSLLTTYEKDTSTIKIKSTDGLKTRFTISIGADKKTIGLYTTLPNPNSATVTNKCTTATSRKIQEWKLQRGTLGNPTCISAPNGQKLNEDGINMMVVSCSIPVYTDNINNKIITGVNGTTKNFNNNNTLDDIVITFGATKGQITSKSAAYTLSFNNMGGNGISTLKVYNSSTNSITPPTKAGSTFKGYYSDTEVTSLYNYVQPYPSTQRIDCIGAGAWTRTNAGDRDRFFQAEFILTDPNLPEAPSQVEINDYRLSAGYQYTVSQVDTNSWKYNIALNITSDMVSQRGIYNYATDYRFIDIEGTTSTTNVTVNYIYLDEGIYFDETGKPMANRTLREDKVLYAKWQ